MWQFQRGSGGGRLAGLLMCGIILLLNGCGSWVAKTNAQLPAPRTPGAIVTNDWQYGRPDGSLVRQTGDWLHIPADEAGELLLWIEHTESSCQ